MSESVTHSLTLGEIAMDQIRRRKFAADPRNYEIWYTYAAGTNSSLNETINEAVAKTGLLNQEDLDRIFETYLSPLRMTDRLDNVGSRLVNEVDGLIATMAELSGNNEAYSRHLDSASRSLVSSNTAEMMQAVVAQLVAATRDIMDNNKKLEERLSHARDEVDSLQKNLEQVRAESLQDPLTTLTNRKHYDMSIHRAVAQARSSGRPLALLITDIDHFKRFNDTYGHLTGDQVLRLVGICVRQNIKGNDIACRYGGEEFAIILPGTPLQGAMVLADQIRRAVMAKELVKRSTGENLGRVTVSIGVAQLNESDTTQSLYERADQALYAAKRGGRNMVMSDADIEIAPAIAVA